MRPHPTIRTLAASEWARYRDIRLRSLAESPDAFGSTLAAEQERSGPAWAARLASAAVSGRDCPLIAEQDGEVIGLLWAKADPSDDSAIDLFQMWVAPEHRGRGVGNMLLQAAVAWARRHNARRVRLGVTCGDTAAVRLYARTGFQAVGPAAPLRSGSEVLAQSMELLLQQTPA